MGSSPEPKIILYTNRGCPWAHRAHIALSELGLAFTEETVDLTVPRTPEYLAINPRGLVPSLNYDGTVLTESAIVANFLADSHPSHLLPASTEPGAALYRARVAFFVDAFFDKVQKHFFKGVYGAGGLTDDEVAAIGRQYVDAVVAELEPLLQRHPGDKGPFFGGAEKLTQVEVLVASFVIRLYTLAQDGVIANTFIEELPTKAPNFHAWAQEVIKHPSVNGIFDRESNSARTKARVEGIKAKTLQAKQAVAAA